jgi:site-specific recombinase XerD
MASYMEGMGMEVAIGIITTPSTTDGLSADALRFVIESRSAQTRRAYRADLEHFRAWCAARQLAVIPAAPATVAEYVTEAADRYKPSTIQRRLAAISVAHKMAGVESPTKTAAVLAVVAGIRRTLGTAPDQHAPAGIGEIRRMVARLDLDTLAGLRDRAILLVGFALAARRSELVALEVADLEPTEGGMKVAIRRSKTDQESRGTVRALPMGRDPETCPVTAVRAWLAAAGFTSGPIFRSVDRWGHVGTDALSATVVATVVKTAAEAAGMDPARYSAHSLRAGFCTTAAARGHSERAIAHQTGHAPNSPVLRSYIRHSSAFIDNAATELGL